MNTLSTIIAARNAAPWLPQCLASVAGQRLPDGWRAQIVLGVDACTETLAAASRIRYPHLYTYYFPNRVGPYVIFNSMARSHPSDVLVRFDADDVMLDGYLLAQLKELGSLSAPMILQTWSIYVDRQLRPVRARLANGRTTGPGGRRNGPSDGQFLMTSCVWHRLGGFRPWWCHGDTEFIRRAAWAGVSRRTIPCHLYLRRMHENSLTQSKDTGYSSSTRRYYVEQIREANWRYARGVSPERLWPMTSSFFGLVGQTA